eukprot:TRINITY_DN13021_c0_g1_i5.p1 TRINITY_DN13021_c0_g1~~TRINITY_DN13021_c0_g1_i5.p1  ORF type:complete len:215 (-),score=13.90 TRINITY_DN13021_c0_g1_i5:313-957(-)
MASKATVARAVALVFIVTALVPSVTAIGFGPLPTTAVNKLLGGPTKAQIKAELQKMVANVTKYYPEYAKYANQASKTINIALSTTYNFTALRDATILLASDAAFKNLTKRLPVNKQNVPKFYNITAYHIVAKRYTLPQLKAMPYGPLPTQLYKQQPIFKMTPANGWQVAFGKGKGSGGPKTWSILKSPSMYTGPYFITHGVDAIQIPAGTVAPA